MRPLVALSLLACALLDARLAAQVPPESRPASRPRPGVTVIAPAPRETRYLVLERWDESAPYRWTRVIFDHSTAYLEFRPREETSAILLPDTSLARHVDGLEPGTYRWVTSGMRQPPEPATEPFRVSSNRDAKEIFLDLAKVIEVRGRVEDPDGRPVAGARVFPIEAATSRPTDAYVDAAPDGSFAFSRLGTDQVRLEACHPAFAKSALATLSGSTDAAVLRLAPPARSARFTLDFPLPIELEQYGSVRIVLYERGRHPLPGRELRAVALDGAFQFTGFDPGVYDVLVDPPAQVEFTLSTRLLPLVRQLPSRMPRLIENVAFDGPRTDLGRIELAAGSSVRVAVPKEASGPAIFTVEARALEAPEYTRAMTSTGEPMVVLSGLRRGRFKVSVLRAPTWVLFWKEIEVDGVHDVDLSVPEQPR